MIYLLILSRALDLLTTLLVTPTLATELNPFVRFAGWKLTILVNIGAVWILSGLPRDVQAGVTVLSFTAAAWNLGLYVRRNNKWKNKPQTPKK